MMKRSESYYFQTVICWRKPRFTSWGNRNLLKFFIWNSSLWITQFFWSCLNIVAFLHMFMHSKSWEPLEGWNRILFLLRPYSHCLASTWHIVQLTNSCIKELNVDKLLRNLNFFATQNMPDLDKHMLFDNDIWRRKVNFPTLLQRA